MQHLEVEVRPSYIWDARFLKVNIDSNIKSILTFTDYDKDNSLLKRKTNNAR